MRRKQFVIWAAILAVLVIGTVGLIIGKGKEESSPYEMLGQIEDAVIDVLGNDCKKVSETKVIATITYGNGNNESSIYYHMLHTTYFEAGDPAAVTGVNTDALAVLFSAEGMDSCEDMMIQAWPGVLYKKDDHAYLCWTCDPEASYVLQYNPNTIPDSEIIKMAESSKPINEFNGPPQKQ